MKNSFTVKASKPLTWNSIPKQGVLVISGHRGQGKSALGWWLAQEIQKKSGKQVAAIGMPIEARNNFPKRGFGKGGINWVTSVEQVAKLKPSIVIADEAAFIANSRRAMSKQNQEWLKLIAICRHKDHLLIFISQHSRQVDIGILMDADLVLLKAPTQLHYKAARAEFKCEIKEAYDLFQEMRGDPRKKVFVVDFHYGRKTMLSAKMPTWWSEKISKSFSSASVS